MYLTKALITLTVIAFFLFPIPALAQNMNARLEKEVEWESLFFVQMHEAKQLGDYAKAISLGEKALKYAKKHFGNQDFNTFTTTKELFQLYYKQAFYKKAEPLILYILNYFKTSLGEQHSNTLTAMKDLADINYYLGQYEKAELYYQDVLKIRKKVLGDQHQDTLRSLNNLADFYDARNRFEEAEPIYFEALQLSKVILGDEHQTTFFNMEKLAKSYRALGHFNKAAPLYLHVLKLSIERWGDKHPETLVSMQNLAHLFYNQKLNKKAERIYLYVLKLRKTVLGNENPKTYESILNLARFYADQKLYEKAESFYREVPTISKFIPGVQNIDRLVNMQKLADLYYNQGHYEKAKTLYLDALSLSKVLLGKKSSIMLEIMGNLALVYKKQGYYEKAEPLYLEALKLSKAILGDQHPNTIVTMDNLAILYKTQGRFKKAEVLYLKVLKLFKIVSGHEHLDTLTSMQNLATLYMQQDYFKKAEPLYLDALKLSKVLLGDQHLGALIILDNLSTLYAKQGHYEKAKPLILETLKLSKILLGSQHPETLIIMNNLSMLYVDQGLYKKAEPLYLETLKLSKAIHGDQHPQTLQTIHNLAMFYLQMKQWPSAKRLFEQHLALKNQFLERVLWAAGEKTRQAYLQDSKFKRDIYLGFFSAKHTRDSAISAWKHSIARKGLLLRVASEVSTLAKQHQTSNIVLQTLIDKFSETRKQLATLTFSKKANLQHRQALEEQLNNLERQLADKVSTFRTKKTQVTPKALLSALNQNQSIIDFLVYTEYDPKNVLRPTAQVIAIVANKQHKVQLVKLGRYLPIAQLISTFRNVINPTNGFTQERQDKIKLLSQKLYQLLWQPLTKYLQNTTLVYLIPDGNLHLLPFKALQNEKGVYLSNHMNIARLASARDIVLPPPKGKSNPSIVISNPSYNGIITQARHLKQTVSRDLMNISFSLLEGTEKESNAITQLMRQHQHPFSVLSKMDASEKNVMKIVSPSVLHLATHGFFLENIKAKVKDSVLKGIHSTIKGKVGIINIENPLARSGLALTYANQGINGKKQKDGTDGILTALEVLNLKLNGTNLVVLSACETGLGDISVGEGVYSLNRAFQEAGAKVVLSTLWSISDEGTHLFMQKFYQHFLNKTPAQQALKKAQKEFKNSEKWQDPFFWAPFVMTGI